jgi:hypothetical protein
VTGGKRVCAVLALVGSLGAGCDALFTGEKVARFALTPRADGGFAPLTIALGPEMNPVALNLRAEYAASPTEAGRWNTYRATLTRAGAPVASREFRINNTSDPQSPVAQVIVHTMLVVDVEGVGDYVLAIDPLAPPAVTLDKPHVELRRNIRRD